MTLAIRARLDPETIAALEASSRHSLDPRELPADAIAAMRLTYAHERRFWNGVRVPLASVENQAVDAAGLVTRLRLYRPLQELAGAALVYLHGGGFVAGSLETDDRIVRLFAQEAGVTVVGVEYALAPEVRFPRQILQIGAVLDQLARLVEGEPLRVAIGGDSAGAHLALAVAKERRDRGVPLPMAMMLYQGFYGLRDSASRRLWGGEQGGLSDGAMAFAQNAYLRGAEDRSDGRFDLLAGPAHGLPPAFISAVALDPLHDDSVALAAMLREAGVPVEFAVHHGVLHGFLHMSRVLPKALDAIRQGAAFLRRRLGGLPAR
jgi:acetyl esterase